MAKKSASRSSLPLLAAVLVAVAATIGLLFYLSGAKKSGNDEAPLIGGHFELIDFNGKPFTDKDLKGKYSLIYFGYTYCPDVCPTELQTMTAALEQLGSLAEKIRPIMISVDPKRDTPKVLKEYLSNFYPTFIGLTGTPEQIKKAGNAYRVFYRKTDEKSASDYLMDHSSIVYLMDENGKYLKHFAYGTTPEKLAQGIRKAIEEHEKGK
jgi:protein SCO1/2